MTDEVRSVLLFHARKYPLMEPTDAVKLLFQRQFGGGHLIVDRDACLARLRHEFSVVPHDPKSSLAEEIGNGLVRVSLAAWDPADAGTLCDLFIRSASLVHGSLSQFRRDLETLTALTDEGVFAFDPQALDAYLSDYAGAGYPAVSHSDAYRAAYRPAYRVVLSALFDS